ncbi:MAG TPA: hypothetical protein VN867_14840 [Candidatus Binataceae bacterium]|nr:hypothetical protein [Candidatus Binataceae bacterium]
MNRVMVVATFLMLAIFAAAAAIAAGPAPPPPELVQLEREVSLKMAHARDLGSIQPEKMKRLSDAHAIDTQGEAALHAGDYATAEADFLKAKMMLSDLGD